MARGGWRKRGRLTSYDASQHFFPVFHKAFSDSSKITGLSAGDSTGFSTGLLTGLYAGLFARPGTERFVVNALFKAPFSPSSKTGVCAGADARLSQVSLCDTSSR
jgi:hypothetical protein